MTKLSTLLKLRGTRFSPTRRGSVAAESHGSHGSQPRRSGMAKAASRLKRHRDIENAAESDVASDAMKLKSVEALQPGQAESASGVYIVQREGDAQREREDNARPQQEARRTKKMNPLLEHVTLVVYGWHQVEPGTLAWVFPSVGAAVAAARAMKNAVKWAIVAGKRDAGADTDLDDARAHGSVLVEQG